MAWSLVASGGAAGNGGISAANIGPLAGTGGTLIVGAVCDSIAGSSGGFTDSLGNTYSPLTKYTGSGYAYPSALEIFYCASPTVSGSMTFYCMAPNYQSACVEIFSGSAASPFDAQNGAASTGMTATTAQPGSVGASGELIVTVVGGAAMTSSGQSIDTGFTITTNVAGVSDVNYGMAMACLFNALGAVNPTWTFPSSVDYATAIASFKAAAGIIAPPPYIINQAVKRAAYW